MKFKNIYTKIIIMLLIGFFISTNVYPNSEGIKAYERELFSNDKQTNKISVNLNDFDAELPTWKIGDSWTYDLIFKSTFITSQIDVTFDLEVNNLKMEVIQDEEEFYLVDLNVPEGDFTGSIIVEYTLLTIEGDFKETEMNGWMRINKSDLSHIGGVIDVDGVISNNNDRDFTSHTWFAYYDNSKPELKVKKFLPLNFPFNVGDEWGNTLTHLGLNVEELKISGINYPLSLALNLSEPTFKSNKWSINNLNNKNYDSLEIELDSTGNYYYYSPGVGNIIKVKYEDIEYEYFDTGYYANLEKLDMNLLSTTYDPPSNAPNPPNTPSGSLSIDVSETASFSTIAFDPDGDIIRYIFDWGDGSESRTDFNNSGETVNMQKKWARKDNYTVKVKARDKYGLESSWSDSVIVNVLNDAPEKPTNPDGPDNGIVGYEYDYSTSSIDPDGHQVKFGWDWNGNDVVDDWSELVDSGETLVITNSWGDSGVFDVKVKGLDQYGEESEWSETLTVTMTNNPPDKPSTPLGPESGKINQEHSYSSSCNDPDGHQVYYKWDWGDEMSGWLGPYDNGVTITTPHVWDEDGEYTIRVKAKDIYGEEGEWSDPLVVSMPKYRFFNGYFIKNFNFKVYSFFSPIFI
ncbi:PKD domain-containing protein [Thermoplasmatota archaeon]